MNSIQEHFDISIYHIQKACYNHLNLIDVFHDCWAISFVVEGELSTRIVEYDSKVTSGDVMIHPPNIPFSEQSNRKGTHIYMLFDLKLSQGISFFSLFPMKHVVTLRDPVEFARRMEQLLELSTQEKTPFQKLKAMMLTVQVLEEIYKSWTSAGSPARPEEITGGVDRFAQLILYMENHLDEKLQREDLAKRMHLHPSYFNRAFKSSYGMSALQMLREMRLKRAMKLLEETEHTMETIAHLCGLGDAAYFNRIFKQHIGKTPGSFRRYIKSTKAGSISTL